VALETPAGSRRSPGSISFRLETIFPVRLTIIPRANQCPSPRPYMRVIIFYLAPSPTSCSNVRSKCWRSNNVPEFYLSHFSCWRVELSLRGCGKSSMSVGSRRQASIVLTIGDTPRPVGVAVLFSLNTRLREAEPSAFGSPAGQRFPSYPAPVEVEGLAI